MATHTNAQTLAAATIQASVRGRNERQKHLEQLATRQKRPAHVSERLASPTLASATPEAMRIRDNNKDEEADDKDEKIEKKAEAEAEAELKRQGQSAEEMAANEAKTIADFEVAAVKIQAVARGRNERLIVHERRAIQRGDARRWQQEQEDEIADSTKDKDVLTIYTPSATPLTTERIEDESKEEDEDKEDEAKKAVERKTTEKKLAAVQAQEAANKPNPAVVEEEEQQDDTADITKATENLNICAPLTICALSATPFLTEKIEDESKEEDEEEEDEARRAMERETTERKVAVAQAQQAANNSNPPVVEQEDNCVVHLPLLPPPPPASAVEVEEQVIFEEEASCPLRLVPSDTLVPALPVVEKEAGVAFDQDIALQDKRQTAKIVVGEVLMAAEPNLLLSKTSLTLERQREEDALRQAVRDAHAQFTVRHPKTTGALSYRTPTTPQKTASSSKARRVAATSSEFPSKRGRSRGLFDSTPSTQSGNKQTTRQVPPFSPYYTGVVTLAQRITYAQRLERMQGELAKLKAVRSSNVRGGRGVAHPLGPATLSPYHEKPSRGPARWGKVSSPTRQTYFEQVRAKLEAERKLRAQHHKQNQMHRLTSVYGRRYSTSPRRGITRPRDRDPLLQAAKTPVVLPLFAPAGVAEAGSREVDPLESLKTNSTTTLVQDARAYAHHLSASAATVTARVQPPAPTEEAGVQDEETQGRGEDMARDSSHRTTAAGLEKGPCGPLVGVGNLTQGSRPKTAPEGMAKVAAYHLAAYHRLPATLMTPHKVNTLVSRMCVVCQVVKHQGASASVRKHQGAPAARQAHSTTQERSTYYLLHPCQPYQDISSQH